MENDHQSDFEKHAAEEILSRYEGKKYTSITLAYNNQNPDGCAIGIVGKRTNEPVPDDESLEAKANRLDTIIGNTLYCTVVYNDGTEQKQSIQIGATVTNFGTAHAESFNQLTDDEKVLKDYTKLYPIKRTRKIEGKQRTSLKNGHPKIAKPRKKDSSQKV